MTVGNTRISGNAGAATDLRAFLEGDLTEIAAPVLLNNMGWSYGTGANAVNVVYADTVPVGNAATVTMDINAGAYLDVFERLLSLEAVKLIYIKNNSTEATLEILGSGALALGICKVNTDVIVIQPGGTFMWTDPSAAGLDSSTNVNIQLTHDGTGADGVNVDVIILGLD